MTAKRYFGTDGIRGRVGHYPISADFMVRLGWAAGRVLASDQRRTVVIGKDTRVSGYMFESALEAGLLAAGADVVLLGPLPTPAIALITRQLQAAAGIVISASHNPYTDNGIKFFDYRGEKLDDAIELDLEQALEKAFAQGHGSEPGKASRHPEAGEDYLRFCLSTLPARLDLSGLRLVLDCAHGATYKVAPELFARLGARLSTIGTEPDGRNINRDVGSTHPQALVDAVLACGADLGIAFDGDGDRVLMVDRSGRIIDGDQLLYVLATGEKAAGRLSDGDGVVGTVMSNLGLELALQRHNISLHRAAVGDRHVHQALHQNGWRIGGESSGHLIGLDWHSTGDGMISALHVLLALQQSGRRLDQVAAEVEKCPQIMINVAVDNPGRVSHNQAIAAEVRTVEQALGDNGRVILRASGTEPLVRVTVEGLDGDQVKACADRLAAAVEKHLVDC